MNVEAPLGQHWLDAARRQQAALVDHISTLLTGCYPKNRRPLSALPADGIQTSPAAQKEAMGVANGSAAASRRADPTMVELPATRGTETGGLATLAAFGHGDESHEGIYFFKPKRATDRGMNEQRMLELLTEAQRRGEPIAEHVPEYHGIEARNGTPNFKMTNLIHDFVEPRLLDIKIGVRCHTESDSAVKVPVFARLRGAPARPLCLPRARLAAQGSVVLPERGTGH